MSVSFFVFQILQVSNAEEDLHTPDIRSFNVDETDASDASLSEEITGEEPDSEDTEPHSANEDVTSEQTEQDSSDTTSADATPESIRIAVLFREPPSLLER